jgi:hypothetical protein
LHCPVNGVLFAVANPSSAKGFRDFVSKSIRAS